MKNVAVQEAKINIDLLIDQAKHEPVVIHRSGRVAAVLLSVEEYERYLTLEDEYWGRKADAAARNGWIGEKASKELLDRLIAASNAED